MTGEWQAATLKTARLAAGLTQAKLAQLAHIDRSRYNALENGRHPLSVEYAERIAPHVSRAVTELLPPTTADPADPLDPLVLLQGLATAVEGSQRLIADLQARVEALERSSSRRRSTGDAQ